LILLLIFYISLPARGLLQYRLKMAPTFLVTGATGTQGGPTAHILLSQKVTVHAFVRNISSAASQALQKAGAILFQGDFDDTTSIKAAMTGVSGIFLNHLLLPNLDCKFDKLKTSSMQLLLAIQSKPLFIHCVLYWIPRYYLGLHRTATRSADLLYPEGCN
jgi:hypothetical protein